MEQGRAELSLVDSVSPELLDLLVRRDLQIIEGLLVEEGITDLCILKKMSSDHRTWFEEVVERIRKCASNGHAIKFKTLGKAVSSSIEESYFSDQRPCGTMPPSDLSKALARSGLTSVECFLNLKLGVRSLECLRALPASEFQGIRAQLLNAGYGAGHVGALKLLHQEVCGQSATVELSSRWKPGPYHERRLQDKVYEALSELKKKEKSICCENAIRVLSEVKRNLDSFREVSEADYCKVAAKAFDVLNQLLPASEKCIRKLCRDVVVLACTRSVNPKAKAKLHDGLRAAFGKDLDRNFLARLGKTCYQLFESDMVVRQELPEPSKIIKLKNTFIELDNYSRHSKPLQYVPFEFTLTKNWANEAHACTRRLPMMIDLPNEERIEAERIMESLKKYFNPIQMESIKFLWAELFTCKDVPQLQGRTYQRVPITQLVDAIEESVQIVGQEPSTVAHCCTALSKLAVANVEAANRVVSIIVNLIDRGVHVADVKSASKLLRIYQDNLVLGVSTSTCTIDTNALMLPTMQKLLSAHEFDRPLRSVCVRVLARSQVLPDLLVALGDDESLWEEALDEVYEGLRQQISWSFWSSPEHDGACSSDVDKPEKAKAHEILLRVSRQLGSNASNCTCVATLVRWAYKPKDFHLRKYRFQLIGILFGVQRTLVEPFVVALDSGLQQGHFDEEHITLLFRALIELEYLELVSTPDGDRIVEKILDACKQLRTTTCISAFVGGVAALRRRSSDSDKAKAREMILTTVWIEWHDQDSSWLVYETLWALSMLLEGLDAEHASGACSFAEQVLKEYQECDWGDPESEYRNQFRNEFKALREAKALLSKFKEPRVGTEEEVDGKSSVPGSPQLMKLEREHV